MSTISAVVCTRNSINSIERCLISLQQANIHELIVVDAHSTDGTEDIAKALATSVLHDRGHGLGAARNLGIAQTTGDFILNFGSDNVLPPNQLDIMLDYLTSNELDGVSAQTIIEGNGYLTFGLNAWRKGRFQPGPVSVIGTPTLFKGDQLRNNPYDATRRFSDDSELCERWRKEFNSRFGISQATVLEIGKTTVHEVVTRALMYGISDHEVFHEGRQQGWSPKRQALSLLHPLHSDFITPVSRLKPPQAAAASPFLAGFTTLRYASWIKSSIKPSQT